MANVINYDKPVSNITITLLINDDDPENNEIVQAVSESFLKALREVRENFPREKWEYYGVWLEEWLTNEPVDDPYLVSKGLSPDDLTEERWKELGGKIEELEKDLSHEKNSPSVDKEDITEEEAFIFGLDKTSHEGRKVNEGVAQHVITRKYFPLEKCISCYQRNTDFCRLVCTEGDEDSFSHEKKEFSLLEEIVDITSWHDEMNVDQLRSRLDQASEYAQKAIEGENEPEPSDEGELLEKKG